MQSHFSGMQIVPLGSMAEPLFSTVTSKCPIPSINFWHLPCKAFDGLTLATIQTPNKGEMMKKRRSLSFKKISLTQKGQGVMEYVILSTLIGVFCLMAVKQFGSVVKNRLQYMRQEVVRTIPTN